MNATKMTTPNPDGPSPRQPALAPTAAELREIAVLNTKVVNNYRKFGYPAHYAREHELKAWACEQCADRIEHKPDVDSAMDKMLSDYRAWMNTGNFSRE